MDDALMRWQRCQRLGSQPTREKRRPMTASTLNSYSQRKLARLAKKHGVPGWHAMCKAELVTALLEVGRRSPTAPRRGGTSRRRSAQTTGTRSKGPASQSSSASPPARAAGNSAPARKNVGKARAVSGQGSASRSSQKARTAGPTKKPRTERLAATPRAAKAEQRGQRNGKPKQRTATQRAGNGSVRGASNSRGSKPAATARSRQAAQKTPAKRMRPTPARRAAVKQPAAQNAASTRQPAAAESKSDARLAMIKARLQQAKDLAAAALSNETNGQPKDRLVVLVRDPYWLHVCWELSRQAVDRAKAALAHEWHGAIPILRLWQVESTGGGSRAETLLRDIPIHGGVTNWYIDVKDPPQRYRLDIGYKASSGQFYCIARSNVVQTPRPGLSDNIDQNWSDVAANFDRIYALSGGYAAEGHSQELQELFEERLRRPMGAPLVGRYGAGVESLLPQRRDFFFEIDAELIVFGATDPEAHVTLQGEPVKLRPDGTFTVRFSLPNCRQVIPAVASSRDGVEQRTVVLAVERNTKTMEPVIRDNAEP
jgi:hypothetical protein